MNKQVRRWYRKRQRRLDPLLTSMVSQRLARLLFERMVEFFRAEGIELKPLSLEYAKARIRHLRAQDLIAP